MGQTKLAGSDVLDFEKMLQPDVQFYKDLAEKRREALNESLNENEKLWIENEEQKEEVKLLKDRVHSLEETVEKARKISELLEPYLNSSECDESVSEDRENRSCLESHSNAGAEKLLDNSSEVSGEKYTTTDKTNCQQNEKTSSEKECHSNEKDILDTV